MLTTQTGKEMRRKGRPPGRVLSPPSLWDLMVPSVPSTLCSACVWKLVFLEVELSKVARWSVGGRRCDGYVCTDLVHLTSIPSSCPAPF